MMGACGSGPAAGVKNGFVCGRSTDVWGIGIDNQCHLVVSWPVQSNGSGGATDGAAHTQGTYVAVQTGGSAVCAAASAAVAPSSTSAAPAGQAQPVGAPAVQLPNTARAAGAAGAAGVAALLIAGAVRARRRRAGA
jgi:hypothetical protein